MENNSQKMVTNRWHGWSPAWGGGLRHPTADCSWLFWRGDSHQCRRWEDAWKLVGTWLWDSNPAHPDCVVRPGLQTVDSEGRVRSRIDLPRGRWQLELGPRWCFIVMDLQFSSHCLWLWWGRLDIEARPGLATVSEETIRLSTHLLWCHWCVEQLSERKNRMKQPPELGT